SRELAGSSLYGALDVVGRHVHCLGLVDRLAQAGIAARIAAAQPGSHRDLFDELREEPAALGVGSPFLVLDRCPLAMTGHRGRSSLERPDYMRRTAANRGAGRGETTHLLYNLKTREREPR